jgi:hypothetical protein
VFYFSGSNGQLRDLKLPLDSYTTPRRSLLRGVCLPPILFLLSDAGLLAVSARPFILSAWVLVVASTTHHLDGNGFIRGHPLLTKRSFKELSLLRLPRYTMVKTGVKMGNVSLIVNMLACLLACLQACFRSTTPLSLIPALLSAAGKGCSPDHTSRNR